jgi:hypothetical protein
MEGKMLASSGAMPTYRKTDKGQAEIETRAFRLSPRLRTPLIMVDGRRNEDELRKLIPQPEETLQALLDQGFIEVVAGSAEPRSSSESASSSKHAASAAATVDVALDLDEAPVPMRFEDLRRQAVRSLIDQVGPAAEGVAMKMEKTRNVQELRPLLAVARDILSTSAGPSSAAAFTARYITPLRS